VHATRLPFWLLPNTDINTLDKMRPGILLVRGRDASGALAPGHADVRQVDLIEVGYCSDTRHSEKQFEKTAQHKELAIALRAAGWTVNYMAVSLGFGGTVSTAAMEAMLKAGAPTEAAKTCMRKLARHAVQYVDKIHGGRRVLTANR